MLKSCVVSKPVIEKWRSSPPPPNPVLLSSVFGGRSKGITRHVHLALQVWRSARGWLEAIASSGSDLGHT